MPIGSVHLGIVDDHSLFRKTLHNFLSSYKNLNVVIQASNVTDLFNKLRGISLDVLLMDLMMPGLKGADAVYAVKSEYPRVKILALSMCADMDLISDILDMGIYGYISKSDEPEELIQAILTVSEDRIYRNRMLTEALYWIRQKDVKEPNIQLSEREKKILQMIWEEKSNKEIAEELFLGIRSVEKIRQDIKEKLGVKSTVGALRYAINKKIIVSNKFKPDFSN
jgi:DNA-binding NarL/FixJ family response regulator